MVSNSAVLRTAIPNYANRNCVYLGNLTALHCTDLTGPTAVPSSGYG